jgi:dihydroorotase
VFKVNPPLRTQDDVDAVREALADGTIDTVGTDHAPHADEDKDCEWGCASFGMIGLETALSVVVDTLVRPGRLDWAGVADRMSVRPAAIGRVADHGRPIEVGEPANLVVVDPDAEWVVDAAALGSLSTNSPFHGRRLPASVVATFLRGRPTALHGKVQHP